MMGNYHVLVRERLVDGDVGLLVSLLLTNKKRPLPLGRAFLIIRALALLELKKRFFNFTFLIL